MIIKKKEPPKYRGRTIELTEKENTRYLKRCRELGDYKIVKSFVKDSGLYLRGRLDGKTGSKTAECGYLFLSKDSFKKCHAPIAHFDHLTKNDPVYLVFRFWNRHPNRVYPFKIKSWDKLENDKIQANMKAISISSTVDIKRALSHIKKAIETFRSSFDLAKDRCNS